MSEEKISLRDHFDERFRTLEKSTDTAKNEIDRRLESMNEFRQQLNRQSGTFITKETFDAKFTTIEKDKRYTLAVVISLLSLALTALGLILK